MYKKKLLLGLAILSCQTNNSQAISNLGQLTLSGGLGLTTSILADKFLPNVEKLTNYDLMSRKNLVSAFGVVTAIGSMAVLYHATPGAKLKKARVISEQINKNRLMDIYADEAQGYINAVLRLLVREDYPLMIAFQELEIIDDLVNQALELLNQALDCSFGSFTKENDLLWEQASLELLKQKVNDRLCFIKYSQGFTTEENKFMNSAAYSTNTFFLGKIEYNLTNFIQKNGFIK